MRRAGIALVLIGSILAALAVVQWRGITAPVAAQGITPIPGRHSEVHTLFHFYVKDTPNQQGWRAAEFKDEGGRQYYKADVLPGCGEWKVAPGTQPGLLLTPGGTDCPGFSISFGVLYWFDTPPISVTPSPSPSPTATVTPPLGDGATATPTATGGVATSTPSPPGGTPTPTHPIITITPTPMFPAMPSCTVQILFYYAGDPAMGGLGGKIGDVTFCDTCNSGCGLWMLGVDKATLDGFTHDANERVHQLWATVTVTQ